MTTSAKKLSYLLLALIALFLLTSCREQADSFAIGCSNNAAGMLMSYAIAHSETDVFSVYRSEGITSCLLMDCCSTKTTWSLTSGDLDGAVLCPDAAANFLRENAGYRIAGDLSYGTEVLVYKEGSTEFLTIGYMSGQDRQKRALEALYPNAQYVPVTVTALSYALHVDEVDAAVLDLTAAAVLDYPYITLVDDSPTTVLVVSDVFYMSAEYPALLLAWENAKAAIGEYEPFCEAMSFLFSEEVGRKEYETWLSAEKKQFPVPNRPETLR